MPSTIYMLNDDVTHMDFVIDVLQSVFGMSKEDAVKAMLSTHRQGKFAIATMEDDKATAVVTDVHARARKAGYPLMLLVEK